MPAEAFAPRGGTNGATVPSSSPATEILAIASGTAGAGTSTVATLLALGAASCGDPVLLVDGAASGALTRMFGPVALVEGGDAWELGPVARVAGGLSVLCGTWSDLPATERPFGSYRLVVIDAGSQLHSIRAACAAGARRFMLVGLDDRFALAGAYAAMKVVEMLRPGTPVELFLNRCDEVSARRAWETIRDGADRFLNRSLGFAGHAPDDSSLRLAVGAGLPISEASEGSEAAGLLHDLGIRMIHPSGAPHGAAPLPLFPPEGR
jgi:MinD-like ATPase involved in chromosome partitioning or flagellar assembly